MSVQGLIILSGPMRDRWRQTRQKQMTELEAELTALQDRIGVPRFRTPRIVARSTQTCLKRSPVGKLYHIEVRERAGHVLLSWWRDEEALARLERRNSRYMLVTNRWSLSPREMFQLYRAKDAVEKRFRISKQQLQVSPLYLHKDQRIEAMLFLHMLALLAHSLLEHQLRQQGFSLTVQKLKQRLQSLALVETTFVDGSAMRRPTELSEDALQSLSEASMALGALQDACPGQSPAPARLFLPANASPPLF